MSDLESARERLRLPRAYDAAAVSLESAVHTGSESLVQQHLKDETDINTIVRRFGITGMMPAGPSGGVFGDFTGISDYESAREMVERAENGFMTLPAEVRQRFENDPGKLVAFAQLLDDGQLARELGFSAPVEEPAAVAPSVSSQIGG